MVEREVGKDELEAVNKITDVLLDYRHVNLDPANMIGLGSDLAVVIREIADVAYAAGVASVTLDKVKVTS